MPLGHDLAAMARAITPRTRIVFVANPNNPTGTWVPARGAARTSSPRCRRHALVALDEAYFEYTGGLDLQDGIAWLREFPNLVVFRTFSKAYGLAGVRVGYAVSHPSRRRHAQSRAPGVQRVVGRRSPARRRRSTITRTCRRGGQGGGGRARTRRGARCEKAGTRVLPSAGNFLMLHAGPDAQRSVSMRCCGAASSCGPSATTGCPSTCA